jgi:hypothetical protein
VVWFSWGERERGFTTVSSVSSRLVAMAYFTVARTASIFGAHCSGSDDAFPPRIDTMRREGISLGL